MPYGSTTYYKPCPPKPNILRGIPTCRNESVFISLQLQLIQSSSSLSRKQPGFAQKSAQAELQQRWRTGGSAWVRLRQTGRIRICVDTTPSAKFFP